MKSKPVQWYLDNFIAFQTVIQGLQIVGEEKKEPACS